MDLQTVIKKYFNSLLIIVILIIVLIAYLYIKTEEEPNEASNQLVANFDELPAELMKNGNGGSLTESTIKEEVSSELFIDVKGEVIKPNVYKLPEGSRILDAINIAGGFTETADQTKINLAARIQDEMVIYVSKIGEDTNFDENLTIGQEKKGKVNLNTATIEELQGLSGIGPSKAASIVDYREEKGQFEKVEDLVNVSGIGEKSLEKIRDEITVR